MIRDPRFVLKIENGVGREILKICELQNFNQMNCIVYDKTIKWFVFSNGGVKFGDLLDLEARMVKIRF